MRVTTDDGVELAVVEHGPGPSGPSEGASTAPGLLMVHGFSGAKEDFTRSGCLERLGATHRVVAFDHRGHGESGKPEEATAYSFDRFAADTMAVADALGLERFRIFGLSLGGWVAQRVVLGWPDRVDALVLADTSAVTPPEVAAAPVDAAAHVALTQGLPELMRRQDAQGGDVVGTDAHRRMLERDPGYKEFCDRKFLDQSPHMYAAIVRQLARLPDLMDALTQVSCPTLVLAGEEDAVFRPESERLAAAIPGAHFAVIEGAGHAPQFEAPEEFFGVVEGFLAALAR